MSRVGHHSVNVQINGFSSLGLYLVRQYNQANATNAKALGVLASAQKFRTAADAPHDVGTIETLKSQLNELIAVSNANPNAKSVFTEISTRLTGLSADAAASSANATSLRDLAAKFRAAAGESYDGTKVFAGDAANPEKITTHYDATNGSLKGVAYSGNASVAVERYAFENGQFVGKGTVNLKIDGTDYALTINSGNYKASEAANAISAALTSQTSVRVGTDVSLSVSGNAITITSLKAGANSGVSSSGTVAGQFGLNAGTKVQGTAARDETVDGDPGAVKVSYAGRSAEVSNLVKQAKALEDAASSGNAGAMTTALNNARAEVTNSKGNVDFTLGRLNEDKNNAVAKISLVQQRLSNLTEANPAEALINQTKASLAAEQAQFALRLYREQQLSQSANWWSKI